LREEQATIAADPCPEVQNATMLIVTAAVIALGLLAAVSALLTVFFTTCVSYAESFDRADFSWKDYPLRRLLDPADFDHLRSRGVSETRIRKLRTERRKLFRLCLRSLARDFNTVEHMLKLVMLQSREDHPDLAGKLAALRIRFYRNLATAEGSLLLHACGCDRMPAIDLLQPLEMMQAQLRQLAPAAVAVGVSA
jgi:hypothetical protein